MKVYNSNLLNFVKELSAQLELLQEELEASGYTSFLLTTRNELEKAFDNLKEKGGNSFK